MITKLRILSSEKDIQSINVKNLQVMLKNKSGYYLKNLFNIKLTEKNPTNLLNELIKKITNIN